MFRPVVGVTRFRKFSVPAEVTVTAHRGSVQCNLEVLHRLCDVIDRRYMAVLTSGDAHNA